MRFLRDDSAIETSEVAVIIAVVVLVAYGAYQLLGARIAEFISATYGLAIYWLGLPEPARNLLPHWVKLVNDPEVDWFYKEIIIAALRKLATEKDMAPIVSELLSKAQQIPVSKEKSRKGTSSNPVIPVP